MNLKNMLESENYLIVCDTNVFLHAYKVSPDFSKFILECLRSVKEFIVLPTTVRIEYENHYRGEFDRMKNRIDSVTSDTKKVFDEANKKLLDRCEVLEKLQYPQTEDFRKGLIEKLNDVEIYLDKYFDERAALKLTANSWGTVDYIYTLFSEINKHTPSLSHEVIYKLCNKAGEDYDLKSPKLPGHKDKKKKGLKRYSDFILWNELMNYAKENDRNIIFVTNDLKKDWWEDDSFRSSLNLEFVKKTQKDIVAFMANDFYKEVSKAYGVEKSEIVDIALNMTDESYFTKVEQMVFEEIRDELSSSGEEFLESGFVYHAKGIDYIDFLETVYDEFTIEKFDFIKGRQADIIEQREELEKADITYILEYEVEMSCTLYDYEGIDPHNGERLGEPFAKYEFSGIVEVEIIREVSILLDFESDIGFKSAEIVNAHFKQI